MRGRRRPSHPIVEDGFLPEDFPERAAALKRAGGVSWDVLAARLGVDPRHFQRWRKGTRPSGDGLCALVKLAARIPGGVFSLLGVHVVPPAVGGGEG